MSLKLHLSLMKETITIFSKFIKMILVNLRDECQSINLQFYDDNLRVFYITEEEQDFTNIKNHLSFSLKLIVEKNINYYVFSSPFRDPGNNKYLSIKMSVYELENLHKFISAVNCESLKLKIKTFQNEKGIKKNYFICHVNEGENLVSWEKFPIKLGKEDNYVDLVNKKSIFSYYDIKLFEYLNIIATSFYTWSQELTSNGKNLILIELSPENIGFYLDTGTYSIFSIHTENVVSSYSRENTVHYIIEVDIYYDLLKCKIFEKYEGKMYFRENHLFITGYSIGEQLEFGVFLPIKTISENEFKQMMQHGCEGFYLND
jgi:hypothetical protein